MQIETLGINDWKAELLSRHTMLLDLREREEYDRGHLPQAEWVDYEALRSGRYVPDDTKTIYIYCDTGSRSYEICQMLGEAGYHTVNLLGGWRRYGK